MQKAIILHGSCDEKEYFSDAYPSLSNSHWLPWLQKQLLMKHILTQTPEILDAHDPDYDKWKAGIEHYDIDEETILIGHSCGGGFFVRWLSENKIKVNKLVLVAPWIDPTRFKTDTFFDFTIDSSMQERIGEIHILLSEDEHIEGVKQSVEIIKQALPEAHYHSFPNMGHFTFKDMQTHEFPELLSIVLA